MDQSEPSNHKNHIPIEASNSLLQKKHKKMAKKGKVPPMMPPPDLVMIMQQQQMQRTQSIDGMLHQQVQTISSCQAYFIDSQPSHPIADAAAPCPRRRAADAPHAQRRLAAPFQLAHGPHECTAATTPRYAARSAWIVGRYEYRNIEQQQQQPDEQREKQPAASE